MEGGISRSGRVRKKSSKLRDYQSADNWEVGIYQTGGGGGQKRARQSSQSDNQPSPAASGHPPPHNPVFYIKSEAGVIVEEDALSGESFLNASATPKLRIAHRPRRDVSESDIRTEDDDEDEDSFAPLAANAPGSSIYMSEKSGKSRQIRRQPRKDKGKTRMTAYMLWARSARNQISGEDLDFAARSRRLGEMWANVPNNERLQWKRRVKAYNKQVAKLAAETASEQLRQQQQQQAMTTTASDKNTAGGSSSKFLNKAKSVGPAAGGNKPLTNAAPGGNRRRRNEPKLSTNDADDPDMNSQSDCTDPVNIAAHLKLLGDSLSNIGESLAQHEFTNSITGTVSVLLDSLLCSVVPLVCLTTHIDGFGHRVVHLKELMQNTLDNIAYVMPGLPF